MSDEILNLSRYMLLRNKAKQSPIIFISMYEAKWFNIPYPLTSGWMETYQNEICLEPEKALKLIAQMSTRTAKKLASKNPETAQKAKQKQQQYRKKNPPQI